MIHLTVIACVVWTIIWVTILIASVGRPWLSLTEAILMLAFSAVAIARWAVVVIVPTLTASQALMAVALCVFGRRWSAGNACAIAVSVVLLSILSFSCYDHLVPSYRWYTDTNDVWSHGLTASRFLIFIGIQSALALFSVWRLHR